MRKTGTSHKTFANKAPFPSNKSKREKQMSLPDKMALNITKKCMRSHKYNNVKYIHYLHLRASRWNTITAFIAFGGGCCCLGTQSCKTFIQTYFDDRLCSGISEWLKTFQMLCNEIGPLVSQVNPSHCAKSYYIFDVYGGTLFCTFPL